MFCVPVHLKCIMYIFQPTSSNPKSRCQVVSERRTYILKPKSEAQGCGASAQSEPDHRMQEIRSRGCFSAYPRNNHLCAYPQNDHIYSYAPQKHLYLAPVTTCERSILLCFSCSAILMRCSCQKFVLRFCTQGLSVQLRIVW